MTRRISVARFGLLGLALAGCSLALDFDRSLPKNVEGQGGQSGAGSDAGSDAELEDANRDKRDAEPDLPPAPRCPPRAACAAACGDFCEALFVCASTSSECPIYRYLGAGAKEAGVAECETSCEATPFISEDDARFAQDPRNCAIVVRDYLLANEQVKEFCEFGDRVCGEVCRLHEAAPRGCGFGPNCVIECERMPAEFWDCVNLSDAEVQADAALLCGTLRECQPP